MPRVLSSDIVSGVMKENIHPKWYPKATITCACGAVYTVGSTVEHAIVELCSACHPVYTGIEKIVDTEGRVDKFAKRQAKAATTKPKAKKETKTAEDARPRTLKEMLQEAKK